MVLAAAIQYADVNQNKCLNRRIRKVECQKCETACPNKSIRVNLSNRNVPVSLIDNCTGCGLCVAACPAKAIAVLHKPPKLVLKNGAVELMCNKQQLDSSIECLGMLDAYALVYFGIKIDQVTVRLDSNRCKACSPGVAEGVKETVEKANTVLRKLGRSEIQLVLRRGKEEKINRRELFAFCFSKARETLLDILPLSLNQENSYRELLVKSIPPAAQQAKLDMSPLFWGSVVNEQCDLCGICVRSCQQSALTIAVNKQTGYRELLHNQSKCIGCMACTLLCPQSALQIATALSDIRIIASQKSVTLASKKCCIQCGKVSSNESPLVCEQCMQERTPYIQSIY